MSLKKIFIYLIAFSAISFNAWSQNKAIVKGLVINQQNQLPISDAQIALLENPVVEGIPTVAAGVVNNPACVKPEIKQAIVDGYTEQLARPVGGEVTEAYLAAMQKGLDVSNAMCTN